MILSQNSVWNQVSPLSLDCNLYVSKPAEAAKCLTEFHKEFFKIMNNSLFGKTCENQKKRTANFLVNKAAKFKQLVSMPQFMRVCIYSENLCVVESQNVGLWINNPFYLVFCILELVAWHMYRYNTKFFCTYFNLYIDWIFINSLSFRISKLVISCNTIASFTTICCNGSPWPVWCSQTKIRTPITSKLQT